MSVWVRAAASPAASAAVAELLTAVASFFFSFFFRRMGTGSNGDRFSEFHWLNRFSI